MVGVMHIGAGLAGLKSEIVHGTRATSEFRERQNLNHLVFGGGFAVLWALPVTKQYGQTSRQAAHEASKQ